MGIMEAMAREMAVGKAGEERKNRNCDDIMQALARPRLKDLKFGDKLRQKKLGEDYLYSGEDAPVVFVRYAEPGDKDAPQKGRPVSNDDIVVCSFVDKHDGQAICFAVDSTHYERI